MKNSMLKALYLAAVAAVFAGSVYVLRGGPDETRGNVRVLSRLDEYTTSNPTTTNTIPAFLMLPGKIGVLSIEAAPAPEAIPAGAATPAPGAAPSSPPAAATAPPASTVAGAKPSTPSTSSPGAIATPAAGAEPPVEPVADAPIPVSAIKPINEAELQKGFCTATLPRLVRQQYPGTYDDIPDADLEKQLLKLHPDYKGRLCVLPVWIAAKPHDIVKYEVSRDALAIPQTVWLWSGLIAAGFAVALLVAYRRLSD